MNNQEIWKDVKGYEGSYQVSSFGRIKSLDRLNSNNRYIKGKILSQWVISVGYYTVRLYKSGIKKAETVHKLVAIAFLNHIPNGFKLVVNHIDFNKLNNNVNNLEIITQRENANQKHLKSSSEYTGVYLHKKSGKWKSAIRINGKKKHLGYFTSELKASKAYQNELKQLT